MDKELEALKMSQEEIIYWSVWMCAYTYQQSECGGWVCLL